MAKRTTILYSTDQIYLHGGIEKVLTTKANYFATLHSVQVFILTTEQQDKPPCYPLSDAVQLINIGIDYNRNRSYFSISNILKSFKHYIRQRKIIKKTDPDFIISLNYNFDHYWLPFIKGNSKLIKERHSSHYFESQVKQSAGFFKKILFRVKDWVDAKYDHIVVLNSDEKKFVRSNNAVVIPNPVPMDSEAAPLSNKIVIAAGRFAPVKAFDELICIWKEVVLEFPDWSLNIYGDDYLNTKFRLEKLISELGLSQSVTLLPSRENFTEILKESSIYALTSVTECFPMVLLESLSVGLPTVAYDCPTGPRNILISGEDGILVSNLNKSLFAESLKQLMGDEGLRKRMGAQAKSNAHRFSTETVMKRWRQLLNLTHV